MSNQSTSTSTAISRYRDTPHAVRGVWRVTQGKGLAVFPTPNEAIQHAREQNWDIDTLTYVPVGASILGYKRNITTGERTD